jgi:predicted short-subunit dehydrogenase-like oxidoreductase (DUF2520 family)
MKKKTVKGTGTSAGSAGKGGRPPRVLFIGAGRAADGLASALTGAGVPVAGFWSRSGRKVPGHKTFTGDMSVASRGADLVLICVSDRAVEEVAGRIYAGKSTLRGKVIAHVSGSLDAAVLGLLRKKGARVAALHPFFSFSPGIDLMLNDIPFSLEGDQEAVTRIRDWFGPLGMRMAELDPAHRTLYHAAAVFCANFTVGLQMASEIMLDEAGIRGDDARAMIAALLGSVALNVAHKGPGGALTGPVARRDLGTIRAHLEVMKERCPRMLPSYSVMTLMLADFSDARSDREFITRLHELVGRYL